MGAKQRGANRGKKAAPGSMKGAPKSQKQLNQSMFVPSLDPTQRSRSLQAWASSGSPQAGNGFSMRDQARATDRHHTGWGETSLRGKAISFVSAGSLKRDEDAWNTLSEGESPQKQSDVEQVTPESHTAQDSSATDLQPTVETPATSDETPDTPQESQPRISTARPVTSQAPTTTTSKAAPIQEEPALISTAKPVTSKAKDIPAPEVATVNTPPAKDQSSDSEEEIVFNGRAQTSQRASQRPTSASAASIPIQPKKATPAPVKVEEKEDGIVQSIETEENTEKSIPSFAQSGAIGLDSPPDSKQSRPGRRQNKLLFGRKYDEDELMQDYIDNMALDDSDEEEEPTTSSSRKKFKKTETFRMFNGDGLENAKVQLNGKVKATTPIPNQPIDWDSDDLADFDDLETTDEEVDDVYQVSQIIRHRSRPSGPQYLVVAEGANASDAKWMLHTKLISPTAVTEIEIYEEIRRMDVDDDDDSNSEEEEEDQDLIDTVESEDDENARIINYTSRMTDEQIARALSKQEELGLGSDELLLLDGDAARNGMDSDGFGANDDFISFNLGKHTSNRNRSKRNKKQRDSFPSAEAFADALDQDPYGAFDVMDFDRPSLKSKKKGRKSDFPWDLAELDEELKDQIVNTWTKDREKKAERKRQKEEARLMADLDAESNNDPGIIKARIRQFMVNDVDTLELSPMDAELRKGIHLLAKSLNLLSRSKGKDGIGGGRYPVLTKTSRTPYYSVETIWEIDNLMNSKKFFSKRLYGRSKKEFRSTGVIRARRGGGGIMSGATYKDGDEVGADAPELGIDNKGRAMMEKMGWSVGMAIGAEGNKGSLDHVRHIVKTTKAGLG